MENSKDTYIIGDFHCKLILEDNYANDKTHPLGAVRIIARAERLAKERHTSISAMFVNYVRALDAGKASDEAIAPITQSLTGIISLPEDFDEKEAITEMIAEKYGLEL